MNQHTYSARIKEVTEILRNLKRHDIIEINGLKGIGKTFLIQKLMTSAKNTDKFIPILINSSFGLNSLIYLKESLKNLLILNEINLDNGIETLDLRTLLSNIVDETGKNIILIIDDLHDYKPKLIRSILSLLDVKNIRILYTSIKPLFANSFRITLEPFSKDIVYEIINRSLRGNITKTAMLSIYKWSGGIPLYLEAILLLLNKWLLFNRVKLDDFIVENLIRSSLNDGVLRALITNNIRDYLRIYGHAFLGIIKTLLSKRDISGLERKRTFKHLITIGLIGICDDEICIRDPLIRAYIENMRDNLVSHGFKQNKRFGIERKLRKLFKNYTIVGDDLRVFQEGLLFQVSRKLNKDKLIEFAKIRDVLNAKKGYIICQKTNLDSELKSIMNHWHIDILFLDTEDDEKFQENALSKIGDIIRKYSDFLQNL